MNVIETTADVEALCQRLSSAEVITVDTEFIRENTYYPRLCLVQIASDEHVAAIDPLAESIDLAPLLALLANPDILKVFHAGRQDMEIFYHLMDGNLPHPVFDTQVAAMVCGFGEQVSYERLVGALANARIDKSARFADWARRPLPERQLNYALSDVTHLRTVYRALLAKLGHNGRQEWLGEEMAVLTDPATYVTEPEDAWRRLKQRQRDRRTQAVIRALAAWREREAQTRDLPRGRVLKDEQLYDIASQKPQTPEALARTRGISPDYARGRLGKGMLAAIAEAMAIPEEELPSVPRQKPSTPVDAALTDLLKVLLRLRCEEHGVASKLVASADEIDRLARGENEDLPALKGWRRELFGADALALKEGRLGLAVNGTKVKVFNLAEQPA